MNFHNNHQTTVKTLVFTLVLLITGISGCVQDGSNQALPGADGGDFNPIDMYVQNIRAGNYSLKPLGQSEGELKANLRVIANLDLDFNTDSSVTTQGLVELNSGPQSGDTIDAIWINVKELQLTGDGGQVRVVPTLRRKINLLRASEEISRLFDGHLPAGKFGQARLILEENNGQAVVQGKSYPLKVSSGDETGLKIVGGVEVLSGLYSLLNLNFQIESLKYTRGEGFILRPTIKLEEQLFGLPFVHGVLQAKFAPEVTVTGSGPNQAPATDNQEINELFAAFNLSRLDNLVYDDPRLAAGIDSELATQVGLDRAYLLYFAHQTDILEAMFALSKLEGVEMVFPDQLLETFQTPVYPEDEFTYNSPLFPHTTTPWQKSYLDAIEAYRGWGVIESNPIYQSNLENVVRIAIMDTGVSLNHPELRVTRPGFRHHYDTCYQPLDTLKQFPYPCDELQETVYDDTSVITDSHGTSVAGVATARGRNLREVGFPNYDAWQAGTHLNSAAYEGVVGTNYFNTEIYDYNVSGLIDYHPNNYPREYPWGLYDFQGDPIFTTTSLVAKGLIHIADQGIDVVNMSFGGHGFEYRHISGRIVHTHREQYGAIDYAHRQGLVMVAAAGNDGAKFVGSYPEPPIEAYIDNWEDRVVGIFPAGFNRVISVAALHNDGKVRAGYSNWGKIDISAPGGLSHATEGRSICDLPGDCLTTTTFPNSTLILPDSSSVDGYTYIFGETSGAAALVSGLATLIKGVRPEAEFTPSAVRGIIRNTALPVDNSRNFTSFWYSDWPVELFVGAGNINMWAALVKAESYNPPRITTSCALAGSCGNYWNESVHFQFTVEGGTPPLSWRFEGRLPHDSILDPATGLLHGSPTWWFGPNNWRGELVVEDADGVEDRHYVNFYSEIDPISAILLYNGL